MNRYLKIIIPVAIIAIISFFIYPRFHDWARAHVNWVTETDDHPLYCGSCHLYIHKNGPFSKLVNSKYYSPFNMALSPDGKSLYVVAREGNSLLVINTVRNKVVREIPVGVNPHSVIVDKSGARAFVSNQWSDNVSVIDLEKAEVNGHVKTGGGPAGLVLSDDEKFLFVVNSFTSDVSVIELASGQEVKRVSTGNNPTGIGKSPDGTLLLVTSRRTMSVPYGDTIRCELTAISTGNQRVYARDDVKSAYMMENVKFTPSGNLAIIPLIRPKNNVPTVQVERGWMMTAGIAVVENKPSGRIIQLLLDEPNVYYSDPFDIVISPDGKRAFITHSGVDKISVIDIDALEKLVSNIPDEKMEMYANHLGISSNIIMKRIPTGSNPKGMALSPDGKTLYVAEHLNDNISLINTGTLENSGSIHLGGSGRITVARRGRRLLNNAGGTFQTQYSCYTCHPDEHEDGLTYNMASKDMGRNMTNTQSLRNIGDVPPYKWNGKNQSVFKQDGMRFSTVLTRSEAFNYRDLDAISAYIMTGIPNPPNLTYNPNGKLTQAQLNGKRIFERTHDNLGVEIPEKDRCVTCHPGPYFTNREPADVGTLVATDDSITFDTPHLNNIWASPPYLHDGRAATLEEIWTLYGTTEEHGIVNDLTKIELNELVEYLKSLGDPDYENVKKNNISLASFFRKRK